MSTSHESIRHADEDRSNAVRRTIAELEPQALRTFTPTQAVIARSAGVYHWTPEGRQLYDYTSGVLVANLGHNPRDWMRRFTHYMGWSEGLFEGGQGYLEAVPFTAYNAITPIEAEACRRLIANLRTAPGSGRLEQVCWAASGSEAVQKALWAALAFDPDRELILATRDGFHGKKGLAGAVTGNESSPHRDPHVSFVSFPMGEGAEVAGVESVRPQNRDIEDSASSAQSFDPARYRRELDGLASRLGPRRIAALITEPYLGGAGSFHPPREYLRLLQDFCREHGILFILDEVQSNFGRTGKMYAFETYGLEPDIVVLGKGLGNGVPVAAAVGPAGVFGSLTYGEASDTWSANPLCCAGVLATLDVFESIDVLGHAAHASAALEEGLVDLKRFPFVRHVRGEGMVWGVEVGEFAGLSANQVANACVLACYGGDNQGRGVHIMGPLAGRVLRIAPPLTITEKELCDSLRIVGEAFSRLQTEWTTKQSAAHAHVVS